MDRAERPRLRPAPVTVSLQPDRLDLRPGRSGDVTVRVTNTGTLVSHYDLVVRGIPAGQAVADPPRVELNPGDTRTVALRITVGEPGPPYAGRHVLGVVLRDAASARCEELTVTVAEAASLDLTVRPEAADGEPAAEYELALTNTGNTPLATRLGAQIADRGVECTLSPATVTVGPGATATARLAVTAPRPWTGNATRSLGVVAAAGSLRAEKQVLMRQRPRIPVGLMWVAGPLSAALVLAATIGGTALVLRRPRRRPPRPRRRRRRRGRRPSSSSTSTARPATR
ncbi:hypothetical protein ACPL_2233 [Actinoplanes sp. SE50/110]|uniref:COG1470 family protein n=1 Tax=Actinoplanes sp. (strain ATCC 31044 / CBS 674.73 / SE50/110) TaxID=134676 RepID=UPI00023EC918|nr:hypothetical protein [Actinoplanes sp. SE50/110]AEV83130.1 hypothetical protein ACPL_2233 [Actinoplanes sp. SE50/110]